VNGSAPVALRKEKAKGSQNHKKKKKKQIIMKKLVSYNNWERERGEKENRTKSNQNRHKASTKKEGEETAPVDNETRGHDKGKRNQRRRGEGSREGRDDTPVEGGKQDHLGVASREIMSRAIG